MAGYVDIVKASDMAVRVRGGARYLRNERDMEKWDLEGKGSGQLLHLTSGDLSAHVHFVAAATCPKSTRRLLATSDQSNANANFLHVKQANRKRLARITSQNLICEIVTHHTNPNAQIAIVLQYWLGYNRDGWRAQNDGVTHGLF